MDIEEHSKLFKKIIKKYNLDSEKRAAQIADILTKSGKGVIDHQEFANLFGMSEEESYVFLGFINKGLKYKEENIDPNANK